MTRLILVILSVILSICCLSYAAYTIIINEPTSTGFIVLIIGCILIKVWQWLINTDSDVDMYIE